MKLSTRNTALGLLLERYNFFRSNTPERRLYEERRRLSHQVQQQEEFIKQIKEKHPDVYKSLDILPF